ncbi:MAG: hypothetical protein OXC26_08620 [Albidovulum sp.]|nr:hypothetical protein [Albidovulum sp.]
MAPQKSHIWSARNLQVAVRGKRSENPMRQADMAAFLQREEKAGRHVFTVGGLAKAIPRESRRALNESLRRMTIAGLLHRAARGVYFNDRPRQRDPWLAERIAQALRPGHFTYISNSLVLSDWSIISQATVALTMMTTGRSGRYRVPLYRALQPTRRNPRPKRHGCILVFSHTTQRPQDVQADIIADFHVLPYATPKQALSDFRRCRPRWKHELDMEIYKEAVAERRQCPASRASATEERDGWS